MKQIFFIFTILFVTLIITSCSQETKKTASYPALDPKNIDNTTKPGDDFFQYANGGWLKRNPIPAERSTFGAFDQLQENNYLQVKNILESASLVKTAPKGSLEQLIGDFYASGMDSAKIEKDGITPLKTELELINNLKDYKDIQKEITHLHLMGIYPAFAIYASQDEKNSTSIIANLYQGGLGLHDRDYYLSDDARSKELRTEYIKHLTNMLKLLGENQASAEVGAMKIIALETQLAKVSKTRVELRDPVSNYNKISIGEIQKLMPNFDWKQYISDLGININEINVGQPKFFAEVSNVLKNTSADGWKVYLKINLLHALADNLNSAIVNENFHFYGTVFTGKEKLKDRWKRILGETSGSLGEAVGQLYVKKYFPPEAKKRMLELVSNLKKSLGERIKNLAWMSQPTKDEALKKLAKINVKIGYPDKWINYSKVEISRDSYVMNSINASKFHVRRNLNKIGKPVDRDEWDMTPQTVNAYYNPNMNEIVFPAAILQPPFFNMDADDAVNYAGIGTVIGHEMTHGFDDQGRQYDKDGNLKDWWTKEDADKFKEHVGVLVKQYSSFVALDSLKINGLLTLGENIADLGGITVSHNAWKMTNPKPDKIDGFTPLQRFVLSYAQIWRQNIRPKELTKRVKEDVHSPAKFRVNGILPNVPQFYEAFPIKPGDKMYLPESERAKIW